MLQRGQSIVPILFVSLARVYAQTSTPWRDPSPHSVQFVRVDQNVRLEVLDWHGSGRPLVLLAGGGDTAHVFDDFAPRLTANFHVYGITRRGFGASGFTATENADRLGDDVLAVLDSLKLERAVLIGHSIAGVEMSSVGTRHPDRVAGLVYLDAMYPYAFDHRTGPAMKEFLAISGPQPPPPGESDLASFRALQRYYLRVLGFTYPEAELREQWNSAADGRVGGHHNFPGGEILLAIITNGLKKYTDLRVPVLAIFANPHGQGTWVDDSTDPKVRDAATTYSKGLSVLTDKQIEAVRNALPAVRIVQVPAAHHYVYLSNEADVLRQIKRFVRDLP